MLWIKRRKKMQFALGDKVKVDGKIGRIILWHFDEGDVWHVEIDGDEYECYNEDMELIS
jgi:hypothetical protein